MVSSSSFRKILDFSVLHGFYLNNGHEPFADMDEQEKERMLKYYQWSSFMDIEPDSRTQRFLAGHQMVFRKTRTGFFIAAKVDQEHNLKPFVPLDTSSVFTFNVRFKDPYFGNYTHLGIDNSRILYISNKSLHINTELVIPAFLGNSEAVSDTFLFEKSILEEEEEGDHIFDLSANGIIEVFVRSSSDGGNIIDEEGYFVEDVPYFSVYFENRKTYWKYIDQEGVVVYTSEEALPLTLRGYIDLTEGQLSGSNAFLPNPEPKRIKYSNNKYYSEIFI
ncbi:hypothetical protein RCC89_05785 [Cytophagaceae bacterium ABcell3]|nr:hypothetical protein RCC89_05785 [Cytophagaceae bacterium ABcell3]